MYILEVVPLTKIPFQKPQMFNYFSNQRLTAGCLILAPLGPRLEKAVVIETHQIKNHKMEIKKADYELRPIKKIITPQPILTEKQIKLALWLGQYYFTSPGLFMKTMLPKQYKKSTLWGVASNRNILLNQLPEKNKNINNKGQKLILVPEATQIKSFQEIYPKQKTAIVQSGLKVKQLYETWQKINQGQAQIIIGTRMAVFAPFINLKEIIIEDETNSHHRSWEMFPHYRTHEVAQKLAELFGAKLILKSEFPSVESQYLARQTLVHLYPVIKKKNTTSKRDSQIQIIDLRREIKEGNYSIFSRQLQEAIIHSLKNEQPVILFINRRGAATFVLCRDCGYVVKCPNCEAPMTYHFIRQPIEISKYRNIHISKPLNINNTILKPVLICHHCGQQSPPPNLCPQCQSYRIKAFGSGSQRVELEAQKIFKEAKIIRWDSDLIKSPTQENQILKEFKEKKIQILIGTQMILNIELPKVPLVAMASADTLMHLPDFRSDERLWQVINQLKKFTSSQLMIQTYNPQNRVLLLAADNSKSFYQEEIEARKTLKYPPFSQLIKLTLQDKDPIKAAKQAKILANQLTQQLKTNKIFREIILDLIGPAPAFISKKKQKYIWQIILKLKSVWLTPPSQRQNLIKLRNKFLMAVPANWQIDVDPETLL